MISVVCTAIFLLSRFVVEIDVGGPDDTTDEEAEEEDVINNRRGIVIFISDHARERMLMCTEWQADGTFKTINVNFFRQVQIYID